MFKKIKKIWSYFVVFIIATILSFVLFILFLNPLTIQSLLGGVIASASQIGGLATVPSNPVNRLAMQLDIKEKELNQREYDLKVIEANMVRRNSIFYNKLLLAVLIALVLLLGLILFNFYFDYKREQEKKDKDNLSKKSKFI